MSEFLKVAKKAAVEAGKIAMNNFRKNFEVFNKPGDSSDIVTSADLEAEKKVTEILVKNFPDHNIIREEKNNIDNKSDYTWFIDPIDGTHNFAFGLPSFGNAIALKHKNDVILSVINLPAIKELYVAEKGKGAHLNGKKIYVSNRSDILHSMTVFGSFWSYYRKSGKEIFDKIAKKLYGTLRVWGCGNVASSFVATGRIDAVISCYTSPWDLAPCALLVEEAGGKVTDIKGEKWNLNQEHYILSNGKIHDKILEILK